MEVFYKQFAEMDQNRLCKISKIVFIISLLLPAYVIDYYGTDRSCFGFMALVLGPLGIFDYPGHYSWYANIFLWLAWRKMSNPNTEASLGLTIIAPCIAGTFLFGNEIASGSAGAFPYHASWGYYCWLFSMVIPVVSSLVNITKTHNESHENVS